LMMFVDLRTVIHRHVPAAEIHHFCAHGTVSRVERRLFKCRHNPLSGNKKGAARNRAAPHLSLVPERLQLASRAPSVAGLAGTLQICLFRLVHEPERLRVLRLRRCLTARSPSRFERRAHYTGSFCAGKKRAPGELKLRLAWLYRFIAVANTWPNGG